MQLKFKEKEFQILAVQSGCETPEWFGVTGLVCRSFGVFKFSDPNSGWSVTHLPSGRQVLVAVSETAAKKIIELLLETDFAWNKQQFSETETNRIMQFIDDRLLPNLIAARLLIKKS